MSAFVSVSLKQRGIFGSPSSPEEKQFILLTLKLKCKCCYKSDGDPNETLVKSHLTVSKGDYLLWRFCFKKKIHVNTYAHYIFLIAVSVKTVKCIIMFRICSK